jgi:murein DD-endopeptidase MepM/ murein hydrolase activator NlpD
VVIEEENLQNLIVEKNKEVNSIAGDIKDKEAAIAEYEKQIAEENATIAALEKAVEAEKAELAAQNARKYDGGMFAMPCPSYSRISDNFGMRMHPTLGIQKMHNGVDFAAPSGSAILAAYDGKVVAAAYNSTMGNYVMISHGSGLYTVYMHASSLSVSTGAEVSKGQKIASVGSTGRSTGPHLHFGVRLNGNYVSPWNYLK